jgi:hypothetical protein
VCLDVSVIRGGAISSYGQDQGKKICWYAGANRLNFYFLPYIYFFLFWNGGPIAYIGSPKSVPACHFFLKKIMSVAAAN